MLGFPIIALGCALIAIGRGSSRLNFDERRRDRTTRRILLGLGILVLLYGAVLLLAWAVP
jgi:hypothetical protein